MGLKMVPFESFGTVSYSHSIVTTAVSLAVSTQYTNVTGTQPDSHRTTAKVALMHNTARQKVTCSDIIPITVVAF